jgi:hypothetical protein
MGLASTRDINNSMSNSKSAVFNTVRLLFQYPIDTAVIARVQLGKNRSV